MMSPSSTLLLLMLQVVPETIIKTTANSVEPEVMTVDFIMQRVFESIENNRRLRNSFLVYQKKLITQDIKNKEKPVETKTEFFTVYAINNEVVQLLVSENGKILKIPKEKKPRIDLDTALANRFQFMLPAQPLQICGNKPCYVVDFIPAANQPRASGADEEVLNRLTGKMIIDGEDWCIIKFTGWLTESFGLGAIATVWAFNVTIEQQHLTLPTGQEILMPSLIVTEIHYRKLLSSIHQRETSYFGPIEFLQQPQ